MSASPLFFGIDVAKAELVISLAMVGNNTRWGERYALSA